MKKNSILFALLLTGGLVSAQQNFWNVQRKTITAEESIVPRVHTPTESVTMKLNYEQLVQYLTQTQARSNQMILKFPDATGNFNNYRIIEQSNFHPDLQEKYASIRSYVGYNTDKPSERINFSISPQFGLYGSIQGEGKHLLIDTYTNDNSTYLIYDKSKIAADQSKFICHTDDEHPTSGLGIDNLDFSDVINQTQQGSRTLVNDTKLRTFRMAVTTTTNYSNFIIERANLQNGTDLEKKAAILAAVNTSITRINGVLRNDVGVHLELIPNVDQLFFLTEDTFDDNDASQMLSENITVTDQIIGTENYDLGHLFFKVSSASNNNGLANLNAVCSTVVKAGGVTGTVAPIGDPFDIDFTAHEIGHQFGAGHTQNNACNRASASAAEPGSGSTIMAYTGICAPNIQANSDAYYHQVSINQINTVLNSRTCGTKTDTDNIAPVVTLAKTNYFIPHSTAFALEMNATDANGDQLTYSWEQTNATVGEIMPPVSANTLGPMFRSIKPSTSPIRYFPKMEKILTNEIVYTTNRYISSLARNNWEVVPNNARNLNFSAIARDNNLNVGLTNIKTLLVRLQAVGPFKLTSQEATETWTTGEEKTITWDVAGTDANNINTANVKILISTNAGTTWDYTLVESTPNNGSYTFTVPAGIGQTTTARLMIRPVDNIYLAVNKTNFTINSPLSTGDVNKINTITISPNPTSGEVNIELHKNFNNVIVYVNDMTGKQVSNYNSAKSNQKSHKLNLNHLPNGVYIVTVKADGEQFTKKLIIKK